MATPTHKTMSLNAALSAFAGKDRVMTIIKGEECMTCDSPSPLNDELKLTFKDALSAKEYQISGMCQRCQDGFFD
jgi:hypothetical protein